MRLLGEESMWIQILAFILLLVIGNCARAQTFAPPDRPTINQPLSGSLFLTNAAPYCSDLKQVTALALTRDRFSSIAGKPREGNFMDTSLPLTGWKDCSIYGTGTYTCDSEELGTAEEAEKAQEKTLHHIKACLGDAWAEAKDRSSPSYAVLHHAAAPVSITLSTDETDKREHIVRLILFVRRN